AALNRAFAAADELVNAYIHQVFQVRHQRQPKLDALLGCRLGTVPPTDAVSAGLSEACNTVCLPLSWADVEPAEGDFRWTAHDQMLDWAINAGFHTVGGPLIDF